MLESGSYLRSQARLDQALCLERRETFVVIMGLAKSGTTLPLTLLDSHPELLVMPEELRFFHCAADAGSGPNAAERLLSDANIQQYRIGKRSYSTYEESMGTGAGARDYSDIDYDLLDALIRHSFARSRSPLMRYRGVFYSYALAKGVDPLGYTKFVSKAPHNEIYCQHWKAMLGESGRYIYAHRDPAEVFLSLRRVASMGGQAELTIDAFIRRYRLRAMLFAHLPERQRLSLSYERLVSDTESTMMEVCSFAGVPFASEVLVPTKNGAPWSGNSSRGIHSEGVFRNDRVARRDLCPESVAEIESRLCDVMLSLGHPESKETAPAGEARRSLDRWRCTLEAVILLTRIDFVRTSRRWYQKIGDALGRSWIPGSR